MRIYGRWAGNPAGRPEDVRRCIAVVHHGNFSPGGAQCSHKRGQGPDGLYCGTHNPEKVAERRAKAQAEADAKWDAKLAPHHDRVRFEKALKLIADGHNDPRWVARQALTQTGRDLKLDEGF